ncbi:MAG: Trm112 family protein [Terracidiphilus sp.]|jgi:uncharacterized protein YbaR (Trm112 family)
MPPDLNHPSGFDLSAVDQLACPACLGDLRADEATLVCVACGRAYPVVDGIPVLIAERAETSDQAASSSPVLP